MGNQPTNFRGASRARSCEGKVRYENSGHARRVMKKAQEAGRVFGDARVYHCRFCGGWHWGAVRTPVDRYARAVRAIDKALAHDAEIAARAAQRGT